MTNYAKLELLHAEAMNDNMREALHTITNPAARRTALDFLRLLELAAYVVKADQYSGEREAALTEMESFLR